MPRSLRRVLARFHFLQRSSFPLRNHWVTGGKRKRVWISIYFSLPGLVRLPSQRSEFCGHGEARHLRFVEVEGFPLYDHVAMVSSAAWSGPGEGKISGILPGTKFIVPRRILCQCLDPMVGTADTPHTANLLLMFRFLEALCCFH